MGISRQLCSTLSGYFHSRESFGVNQLREWFLDGVSGALDVVLQDEQLLAPLARAHPDDAFSIGEFSNRPAAVTVRDFTGEEFDAVDVEATGRHTGPLLP